MNFVPPADAADASADARVALTNTMDLLRRFFDAIDRPVEVALIAVQIPTVNGPIVVTLTHPLGEYDRVANIAHRAEEIFRREGQ